MLCNGAGHDVGVADALAVVGHGFTLDFSTSLYLLIIPFLASLISLWVRVPRRILTVYYGIVALALALAFVADTSLYRFWGFKLDASCLQYLSQPEGITQSVSLWYLLWRLLLIVACTIAIYLLYSLTIRRWDSAKASAMTLKAKWGHTALHLCLMPLMVIGIRGGLSESTTNIGQVYFSQNQFLNHSAVNPVFSFLYSLSHQTGDLSEYQFFSKAESLRLTANVYTTRSLPIDTLLATQRPNVVVILMESAGEQFADAMPHLQQLKQEGVSFSRCYANSWRTDRGTLCTLSGYPSFPSLSVMKMPEKSRSLPSIARTLKGQGYATTYLYGGDINFTNMRSYLIGTGWNRLISVDDYNAEQRHSAKWGVRDDITFATLYDEIVKASTTPSLWGYSTLSSHEPWDVPVKKNADEVLNAFTYLDDCLHAFITRLKGTAAWNNLLIVITADHGINHGSIDQSQPLKKNHIPMLWVGGAVRKPCTVDVICNQSDMPATLLGQMGLPHSDFAFSRDVTSRSYTYPIAVHNYNNAQWAIDSTGHVLYDFDARRTTISESSDANRLVRVSKGMLQRTCHDLEGINDK